MKTAATGGASYEPQQVWLPASEMLLDWDTDFHDLMLGDQLRMTVFRSAVAEVVRPGMTVLDLGTGTGILALWALESGATRVYGNELDASLLRIATERIQEAGYGDRFQPVHGISFDVDLPEPVDVVISETLGNLADNEGCVDILADARRRFLRDGGVLVPASVESYLVPVAAGVAHAQVREGRTSDDRGGDLLGALLRRRGARSPFDLYYDVIIPSSTYLAAPRVARLYSFDGADESSYCVRLTYPVHRAELFTGFKGYFVATMSDTVALDISGDDIAARNTSDSWKHCYLPIADPVPVRRGDRIVLQFSRARAAGPGEAFGQDYAWQGFVMSGGRQVAQFSQGTAGSRRTVSVPVPSERQPGTLPDVFSAG